MSKNKTIYACTACGAQFPKWAGRCTECGAWNSLSEETLASVPKESSRYRGYAGAIPVIQNLEDIQRELPQRQSTGMQEFDRVLGGGLVAGSIVLLGGDPGIGKSTLLLQALTYLQKHQKALYISGEESLAQIADRAHRLGLQADKLRLLAETQVESILSQAEKEKPQVLVVDSVQTIFTELLSSAPGSVGQVRESTAQLVRFAKQTGTCIFLVGHVTKEGALAGPRVLEHMVDTVLYFEGEAGSRFRCVRAVKNRFGAVNELGLFAMTEKGLKEVTHPSALFLSQGEEARAGSVVLATWEGTRPLLVEVQALVDQSYGDNPRRLAVGLEQTRLAMLLAVLHRHAGVATYNQDVFINAVGGMRVEETAADLALLIAIVSSLKNHAPPSGLLVFGEVGLGGELRPVPYGLERLKEASKHGLKQAIIPVGNQPKQALPLKIIAVKTLNEALSAFKQF